MFLSSTGMLHGAVIKVLGCIYGGMYSRVLCVVVHTEEERKRGKDPRSVCLLVCETGGKENRVEHAGWSYFCSNVGTVEQKKHRGDGSPIKSTERIYIYI